MILILEIPVSTEQPRCLLCVLRTKLRYFAIRALRLGIHRVVDDATAKRFALEYKALLIEPDETIRRKVADSAQAD